MIDAMNTIAPQELKQWMIEQKDFLLIDVRESFERDHFNIGGQHIPFEEVMSKKELFTVNKPVVFYCEKGIRSGLLIQRLEALGFENLYNLSGGMKAWKQQHN